MGIGPLWSHATVGLGPVWSYATVWLAPQSNAIGDRSRVEPCNCVTGSPVELCSCVARSPEQCNWG